MSEKPLIPKDINFLVVDDMSFYYSLLKDHIKKMGFTGQVFQSLGVKDATEILKKNHGTKDEVHFIIVDLHMADYEGTKLVELARSSTAFANIPILLFTSETEKEQIINAFEIGITSYLFKPWEYADLKEKVLYCWSQHH